MNFLKTKNGKRVLVLAGLLLLGIVVLTLYLTLGKKLYVMFSNSVDFRLWLEQFGRWDEVVFVGIRALQTVVKFIPAEPLEIGSGYVYGIWGGLFYCMLGTEIGSFIILFITKLFGMKVINLFVSQEKIDSIKFLQNESKLKTTLFFIYLIPGTPKDFITYFIGKTKVKISHFLIITGIARIPSIITSTWCGAELGEKNYLRAAIIFGVTLAISLIGTFFYKKFFEKKDTDKNEQTSHN
ncbi:MAG: TVP38/TMEM64 family protein [Ruminococcaceae bacterium]|nr:TVP38/TMEM64 family protein [Oscillospiraceae bacterium]